MDFDWQHWVSSAISGGFGGSAVKLLDYAYNEYRRGKERRETARQVIDRHLDPILKAADDLVGKLQSLAGHDFQELRQLPDPADAIGANTELTNILYLFGQFWSRVQILRQEALYVKLAAEPSGERLKSFLETLERRGVGVVDRPCQRGMGESLIRARGPTLSCMSYYEFVTLYLSNQQFQEWFRPLKDGLLQVSNSRLRQRILLYGSVLHAMIDSLDPRHLVTSERRGWANKLSQKSSAELRFASFPSICPL